MSFDIKFTRQGLENACDCGISWSYSLAFRHNSHTVMSDNVKFVTCKLSFQRKQIMPGTHHHSAIIVFFGRGEHYFYVLRHNLNFDIFDMCSL